MQRRFTRLALALATALLVAGCGFQLRGTGDGVQLPDDWRALYLLADSPNSEFTRAVETQSAARGVEWTDSAAEANYIVKLGPEQFSQRNLSISADARAAEFELTMRAVFSVRDREGEVQIPDTTASVVKQMENDPQNVVGKAEEVRVLKNEMRVELSRQILRRIAYFAASQQP